MIYKSLLPILLTLIITCTSWAQETNIYTHQSKSYQDALLHFDQGNYTLAQKTFTDFIAQLDQPITKQLEIKRVISRYHVALCARKLKSPDAEYLFTQFIEQEDYDKYNSQAYYHLGQIYFEKKRYRNAIAAFESISLDDLSGPQRAEYYFQNAYANFVSKNIKKAKQLFGRIINVRNQYYYDANYYYGVIGFFDRDLDSALSSFKKIEKNKKYARAIPYYISLIYFFRKESDQLLRYAAPKAKQENIKYRKELNQLVGQTYFNRQKFQEALPFLEYYVNSSGKVAKDDIYQLAFTQYRVGRYNDAIKNFRELNALNELMGQNALYHLADCYLRTNQKEKARNAFNEAARYQFDRTIQEVSAFNYAKLSYELGFNNVALSSLQGFLNSYPSSKYSVEARSYLSTLFESSKNYEEALQVLETIPNKSPQLQRTQQRAAYYRAVQLFKEMRFQEAMGLFDQAIQNPKDPQIAAMSHFWKGDIYYRRMQYETAIGAMAAYLKSSGNRYISDKVNPATANYTIGYSLYKIKRFNEAKSAFDRAVSSAQGNVQYASQGSMIRQVYPDALLRSGDCNFLLRNYPNALTRYNQVIQGNMPNSDYAYYQKGILEGLQGNEQAKIATLSRLLQMQGDSPYGDDALYQIALSHVNLNNKQAAIDAHERLRSQYPNSQYAPQSLTNQGLIYFNMNKYNLALQKYDEVLKTYPYSPESQEALAGIKDVYFAKGDAQGYGKHIRKYPGVEFSNAAEDSLTFEIAETHYNNGDCNNAIQSLNRYLSNFPKGVYALYAHHYRGMCLYSQEKYLQAGKDFDFIIDRYPNLFYEKALDRGARISFFMKKDYEESYKRFKQLAAITKDKTLRAESLRGLVKCSYLTKRYAETQSYSQKLLQYPQATDQDKIDGHFYKGMAAYESGNTNVALSEFKQVAQLTDNEQGAQVRYLTALIYFERGDLEASEEACRLTYNETSAHEEWTVKSFRLLAEIYVLRDELFQAKATLKSILDNYEKEDQLKRETRERLREIEAKEEANSKIELRPAAGNTDYLEMEPE